VEVNSGAALSNVKSDILQGWKDIAIYVSRDERTVKRWEKDRGLPVRRMPGKGRANVYAVAAELDAWLSSSPVPETESLAEPDLAFEDLPAADPHPDPKSVIHIQEPANPTPHRSRTYWSIAAAGALAGVAFALWHSHSTRPAPPTPGPYANTGQLGQTFGPPQPDPSSPVSGVDDLCFRGVYYFEQRTPDSLNRAQDSFTQAIAKDPKFAPAWAGLASTYDLMREYSIHPPETVLAMAADAARKAIALDPKLAQGHAALGFAQFFGFLQANDAEREFRAAISLNPNSPLPHSWYGSVLMHEARFPEAIEQFDTAYRLQPSSAAIMSSRAMAIGLGGHRDEAVDLLQEMISQNQAVTSAHLRLAILSLIQPRDIPRYLDSVRHAYELTHNQSELDALVAAEKAYHAGGEPAMWRAIIAQKQRRDTSYIDWHMAEAEAALGQNEQAIADLQLLVDRHDPSMVGLEISPLLLPLHSDPRFQKLLAQVGLPPLPASPQ